MNIDPDSDRYNATNQEGETPEDRMEDERDALRAENQALRSSLSSLFKSLKNTSMHEGLLRDNAELLKQRDALREITRWERLLTDRKAKKPAPFRTMNRSHFLRLLTSFKKFLHRIDKASELQLETGDEANILRYWKEISDKMSTLVREKTGAK